VVIRASTLPLRNEWSNVYMIGLRDALPKGALQCVIYAIVIHYLRDIAVSAEGICIYQRVYGLFRNRRSVTVTGLGRLHRLDRNDPPHVGRERYLHIPIN